jgi:hypothetical protein
VSHHRGPAATAAASIPAASTNSGLSGCGQIASKVGRSEPQVGHGPGLASLTSRTGRTECDVKRPFPDCQGAQQEHNVTDFDIPQLSPDLVELLRGWAQVPDSVKAAILAIVKSASWRGERA